MPILSSGQSPLLKLIEDATSPSKTELDWNLVMTLVDYLNDDPLHPKECVRTLIKQLSNKNPRIVLNTISVLDVCVNNCGKRFHLELSCREFENEVRKILSRQPQTMPHQVYDALVIFIKKWGESKEFTEDSQLSLIPSIYRQLKKEGFKFPEPESNKPKSQALPTDPNVVSSAQEEEDIAKAIELSLRDAGGGSGTHTNNSHDSRNRSASSSGSMYPTFDLSQSINSSSINGNSSHVSTSGSKKSPTSYQVRAMYDFEAAEDNELTFKAGEIIVVLDDSDPNWWKGSNHRGEGLFPANFVTTELNQEEDDDSTGKKTSGKSRAGKSVQFKEEVSVRKVDKDEAVTQVTIDVEKIDKLLHLMHEADPTDEKPDSDELVTLEEQCCLMAPLIDEELKTVDRRLASLDSLSSKLVEAMSMYYSLMQNAPASDMAPPVTAWNGNIAASAMPTYGQMHPNVMSWNQQQQQPQLQQHPQQSTYQVQQPPPPVASTTATWNQVPVAADGTYIAPTSSTGNSIYEHHHPYYGQINTVAPMPNYGEATGLNTQVAPSLPPSNPILSHPNQPANPANLQN